MSNEFDDDDDDDGGFARTSDPLTSHEALNKKVREKIAAKVEALALAAGTTGITINEAAALLPEYKAWSISPSFAPLVRRGILVLHLLGLTKPTERWPRGKELYEKRADPHTKAKCKIHYHHSVFEKRATKSERRPTAAPRRKLDHGS